MKRRMFDCLKSVIFSDMEGVTDFSCIKLFVQPLYPITK